MEYAANQKKSLLPALILFGLMAVSLITPLGSIPGSYPYLPDNDWRAHNALVIQAKNLQEKSNRLNFVQS